MKIIEKILLKVSPSFRMLIGNRERVTILLDEVEILKKIKK